MEPHGQLRSQSQAQPATSTCCPTQAPQSRQKSDTGRGQPIPRDKALINKFSAPVPEWKPLQPKKASLCIPLCLLSHFISALLMVGRRAGRTRGQVHKTGTFEGGFEIRGEGPSAWPGDRRPWFMAQFCHCLLWAPTQSLPLSRPRSLYNER